MELSLITPTAYMEMTKLLGGRFCIAPIARDNKAYFDFFLHASQEGYKVILDNGVFESDRMDAGAYIDLAIALDAKVVVAPDMIGAPIDVNRKVCLEFAAALKRAWPVGMKPPALMYVPQCSPGAGACDQFYEEIDWALCSQDAFDWIGICRDAVYNAFKDITYSTDQEINRLFFVQRAIEYFSKKAILGKHWHFLGLGQQLHLIQHYWFVDSMDTATLFYHATCDNMVAEGFLPPLPRRPKDYFKMQAFNEFEPLVEFNCRAAKIYADKADELRHTILGDRL